MANSILVADICVNMEEECVFTACIGTSLFRLLSAYVSLSVYGLVFSLFMYALLFADFETSIVLCGLGLNETLNIILKVVVNADRPDPTCGEGPGFPSGHAQTVAYILVYSALRFYYTRKQIGPLKVIYRYFVMVLYAMIVCASRVHLRAHTIVQVLFGFLCGVFVGATVFYILDFIFHFVRNDVAYMYRNKYHESEEQTGYSTDSEISSSGRRHKRKKPRSHGYYKVRDV